MGILAAVAQINSKDLNVQEIEIKPPQR
ncbi:hypothetical protein SPHINGOR109_60041 [Sphingorhabdus sp. 109]|nr:hypothetical protein SPHINGOR109_60041 [Sphingorhabdus sp. 109]